MKEIDKTKEQEQDSPEKIKLFRDACLCYLIIPTEWYINFMSTMNVIVIVLMLMLGIETDFLKADGT